MIQFYNFSDHVTRDVGTTGDGADQSALFPVGIVAVGNISRPGDTLQALAVGADVVQFGTEMFHDMVVSDTHHTRGDRGVRAV